MQKNPELYAQLVEESADTSTLEAYGQIELDLPRTFPDHLDFRANLHAAPGEDAIACSAQLLKLRRVLRAYARRNASVGYCQGLNFIVGLMLLVLDRRRRACSTSNCHRIALLPTSEPASLEAVHHLQLSADGGLPGCYLQDTTHPAHIEARGRRKCGSQLNKESGTVTDAVQEFSNIVDPRVVPTSAATQSNTLL